MSKVPQHLIEEATRMGIVPGATASCALSGEQDTRTIPPVSEWLFNEESGEITHRSNGSGLFIHDPFWILEISKDSRRWATVVAPAPTKSEAPQHWINGDPNEAASHRQISYIMRLLDTRHVRKVTAEKIIAMLSEEHEYGNGLDDLKQIQRPS